ncbi:hypothetical protein ACN47E_007101 [Coniothyrium glycines]
MESEALQWLEWHYAGQIYSQLKQTDALTFNMWCIFRTAFPKEIDQHHQFTITESSPVSEAPVLLPSITARLNKLDAGVLTSVCIDACALTIEHLISLTKITTLATLALEQHSNIGSRSGITDRTMRDWGRAVHESNSFNNLKLLVLSGVLIKIAAVLQGVSRFPRLALLGVHVPYPDEYAPAGDEDTIRATWVPEENISPPQPSPSTIWADPRVTKVEKLRKLQQVATAFASSDSGPADDASSPTITLHYARRSSSGPAGPVSWFYRVSTDGTDRSKKRVAHEEQQTRKLELAKKRRVQSKKKVDVGAFLDTLS